MVRWLERCFVLLGPSYCICSTNTANNGSVVSEVAS
jgi:hypothetical protein